MPSIHAVGSDFEPATWSAASAHPAAESDGPFAFDVAGMVGAAGERNPFASAVLLIAFAGMTAFFWRRRTRGRGLISV